MSSFALGMNILRLGLEAKYGIVQYHVGVQIHKIVEERIS